jgi:hypothetical protein
VEESINCAIVTGAKLIAVATVGITFFRQNHVQAGIQWRLVHQEQQEEIEQKGKKDGKDMEVEVQQGEDVDTIVFNGKNFCIKDKVSNQSRQEDSRTALNQSSTTKVEQSL